MSDDSAEELNRFVIVLLALLLVFAAALVMILAWGAPTGSIDRIVSLADWLRRHNDRETKVIITLGGAIVVLSMLLAIIIEVTPSPTRKMRLRNVRAGDATITTREIAERVNAAVMQVEHIAECRSIVAAHGRRVEVVLDLHVDAGADLTRAAEEACARTRQLVEHQIDVELTRPPRAHLHYRELRLRVDPPSAASSTSEGGTEEAAASPEGERDQRGEPEASQEA